MKATLLIIPLGFALGLAPSPAALASQESHEEHELAQSQKAGMPWADGTVKKVSPDTGRVTISHGPLPSLDMPPMTMVFRVKDPAWLIEMKPGDRIRFAVERVNGALTVTEFKVSP